MPVVSDEGWIAINQRRKAKRDEVRKRFQAGLGVSPAKTISDWTSAPQAQVSVVASLIQKTAGFADDGIKTGMALMQTELGRTGLGLGAMGSLASTALDLDELMPVSLVRGHFLPPFGEAD
jgi:hypothetical protein